MSVVDPQPATRSAATKERGKRKSDQQTTVLPDAGFSLRTEATTIMGSSDKIMEYRKEKIRKFMQLQQKEDDELFFVIVPAILQCLNDEKRPVHTSEYTGAKKMKEILEGHEKLIQ